LDRTKRLPRCGAFDNGTRFAVAVIMDVKGLRVRTSTRVYCPAIVLAAVNESHVDYLDGPRRRQLRGGGRFLPPFGKNREPGPSNRFRPRISERPFFFFERPVSLTRINALTSTMAEK